MATTPLIYATRSILPSTHANAVQSAHMAHTLGRVHTPFEAIYRTKSIQSTAAQQFAPYGIAAPDHCRAVPVSRFSNFSHSYLRTFQTIFEKSPSNALIYTRSTRLAWAALRAQRRMVLELHDPLIPIRTHYLKRWLKKGALPALIVTTERLRADVISAIGLSEDRILVAGGAAPAAYPEIPAVLPEGAGEAFHVGYAGSALPGKGVEVVLACARQAPEMRFHLIGPSPKDCRPYGDLPANVAAHGFQAPHTVIGLLKGMDALLLPNHRRVIIRSGADIGQHTSPLKLFEYLASGKPIVASDLPIFATILENGRNALLAPPESIDDFVAQLRKLQNHPELGRQLGVNALADFRTRHTWEHRVERILAFLRRHEILPSH